MIDVKTNRRVISIMLNTYGADLNPMSGVPGTFYTARRYEDLMDVVNELIAEKSTCES